MELTRPQLAYAAYLYDQNPPNGFRSIGGILHRDHHTIARALHQNLPESVTKVQETSGLKRINSETSDCIGGR
jgi:hypothetical protein